MFSNKEAWMEGYEAGYAAAQEEISKLTAERDAAVADLAYISHCDTCKFSKVNYDLEPCKDCGGDFWEWRGVNHDKE